MKTENIEQKLRDYYHEIKSISAQTEIAEDIDDNLIARYIEGTATPDEIVQLEKHAEANEQIKILLQILTTQELNEETTHHLYEGDGQKGQAGSNFKRQISNFFCLSHPTTFSILRCAVCLVIIATGSIFIVGKIKPSCETDAPQITLRGGPSSTNIYQLPITNKNDKADY